MKKNLLIADDDPGIRLLLTKMAKPHVANLFVATDGVEALDILNDNSDDIHGILSDFMMPNMNGIELLQALRKQGHQTPFSFLTAHGRPELRTDTVNLQVISFIPKPFDKDKIVIAIHELFATEMIKEVS